MGPGSWCCVGETCVSGGQSRETMTQVGEGGSGASCLQAHLVHTISCTTGVPWAWDGTEEYCSDIYCQQVRGPSRGGKGTWGSLLSQCTPRVAWLRWGARDPRTHLTKGETFSQQSPPHKPGESVPLDLWERGPALSSMHSNSKDRFLLSLLFIYSD